VAKQTQRLLKMPTPLAQLRLLHHIQVSKTQQLRQMLQNARMVLMLTQRVPQKASL
jgi:hypothetical protein